MFCTQCGNTLQEVFRFCPACGKPVDEPPPGADPVMVMGRSRRTLHRVMARKRIAGVCAGFAEYFEVDLTLMRIIFVALTVLPPAIGLIAYVIAWIAMPKDTPAAA
ncbi:MAG: PspC domain-containing protein [Acidobacteriota bacterium]|nr:PspC domain-containing protein [Acidobacteriota bacterium]